MTNKQMTRLIKQCAHYKAQLGARLAAIVESDTGVMTTVDCCSGRGAPDRRSAPFIWLMFSK